MGFYSFKCNWIWCFYFNNCLDQVCNSWWLDIVNTRQLNLGVSFSSQVNLRQAVIQNCAFKNIIIPVTKHTAFKYVAASSHEASTVLTSRRCHLFPVYHNIAQLYIHLPLSGFISHLKSFKCLTSLSPWLNRLSGSLLCILPPVMDLLVCQQSCCQQSNWQLQRKFAVLSFLPPSKHNLNLYLQICLLSCCIWNTSCRNTWGCQERWVTPHQIKPCSPCKNTTFSRW